MKRRSGRDATAPVGKVTGAGRRGGAGAMVARHAALLTVVVVIALVALVRVRLMDTPLERDEGEYAYAGQLILRGIPPYLQAYNMKFPGTYYAYAGSMALFGETPRGIRLGLILVNIGTTWILFALGRRLLGSFGGAVAAISFALLSLDRWNLGIFAHATHYVLLPALGGLYCLVRAADSRRTAWLLPSGLLLGLAMLMKQHAIAFLPLGVFLLIWEDRERGRRGWRGPFFDSVLLIAGVAVPAALLGAVLQHQGVLAKFWFWTFRYAREYVSEISVRNLLANLWAALGFVTQATRPLWLIGGAGLVVLWSGRWPARVKVWASGLLVASLVAVCPGFFFRPHYFILLLPALALLVAVLLEGAARLLGRALSGRSARGVSAALFALVCGVVIVGQGEFFFAMSSGKLLQICYGVCPFTSSIEVAKYIREHTTESDRIAVLGSEPEIYFYAHRLSATGYIYVYPLMEPQPYAARMQNEMMAQVEAAHPRYTVFVQDPSSWSLSDRSDHRILNWAWRYVSTCYRLVGVVDVLSGGDRSAWDDQVAGFKPGSTFVTFVYERKDAAPCAAGE